MKKHKCSDCPLRTIHDNDPTSLIGRFWRWHINFCPGWKNYFTHLSPTEQEEIRNKYNFTKHSTR